MHNDSFRWKFLIQNLKKKKSSFQIPRVYDWCFEFVWIEYSLISPDAIGTMKYYRMAIDSDWNCNYLTQSQI